MNRGAHERRGRHVRDLREHTAAPQRRGRPRGGRGRRGWGVRGWGVAAGAALVAGIGAAAFALAPGAAAPPPAAVPRGAHLPVPPVQRHAAAARVVNGRRQPPIVRVPDSAGGHYQVVPGGAAAPAHSRGTVVRYIVEVERGLPISGAGFAAQVHRVLNDPRSWGHGGRLRFVRVSHGPARVRVSLTSPDMVDRMCAPLNTAGQLSCGRDGRSVLNARRWGQGAASYGRDLATYREYLINHEVGHLLGHDHRQCPGHGRRAPVMVQQTKSLQGCRPNPWPFP
ncbi:DUF3152 domain-containing protein [Actinomadura barringtoniae]|uniref:DUF3152 domain-containing protein n=1 Tax=Actinomadura barringtoniae TaxID=1427535 RepID=A0A939TCL9_9ACTN|nr:DUF3152 domain-containing protein [Actinomadura barringtoniae]